MVTAMIERGTQEWTAQTEGPVYDFCDRVKEIEAVLNDSVGEVEHDETPADGRAEQMGNPPTKIRDRPSTTLPLTFINDLQVGEPCTRRRWGFWPYGPWYIRLHGAKQDWRTYGVPQAYTSALDGTIIASEWAPDILEWEGKDTGKRRKAAEQFLAKLQRSEGGGSGCWTAEAKMVRERKMRILAEMLDSSDPVVRRMITGLADEFWKL